MSIVTVAKVPVDSNFVIGVFNRQFKVSATVVAADDLSNDIFWFLCRRRIGWCPDLLLLLCYLPHLLC